MLKTLLRTVLVAGLLMAGSACAKDVAIFGAGLGAGDIAQALTDAGWEGKVDITSDMSIANLVNYDVFVLPITSRVTDSESSKENWRENLQVFVRNGGGFVVTHDSCGFRYEIKESVFPDVAQGIAKLSDREVEIVEESPAIPSFKKGQTFQHGYFDHIQLRAGKNGTVLAVDKSGTPCVVMGPEGSGRAAFLGFGYGVFGQKVDDEERVITLDLIQWAAGGEKGTMDVAALKKASDDLYVEKQRRAAEEQAAKEAKAAEVHAMVEKATAGKAYVAIPESPLRKIFQAPNMMPEATLGRATEPAIEMSACRNEYEGYQVVLLSQTADLQAVDMRFGDLQGPDGAVIPASQITPYVIGYLETHQPRYQTTYVGWWPDVLLPYWKVDVPKGQVQPLWFIVHVPEDAQAGDYQGWVEVQPEGLTASRIPLKLHVWSFLMPKKSFLPSYHHADFRGSRLSDEGWLNFFGWCFEHRMCPNMSQLSSSLVTRDEATGKYDFSPMDKFMKPYQDVITSFRVMYGGSGTPEQRAYVRDCSEYLQGLGLLKYAFFYMEDEPAGSAVRLAEVKMQGAWMHEAAPDILRLCTTFPLEDLKGLVDVWCPHMGEYVSVEAIREEQAAGRHCWWYSSTYPQRPWPNKFIDYPAIDHRVMWWLTWTHEITGYLCTEIATGWGDYEGKEATFASMEYDYQDVHVPWYIHQGYYGHVNGNHDIVFAGPDETFLSSIRAENVRDGIEDFDTFYMLRMAALKLEGQEETRALAAECRAVLEAVKEAAPNGFDWTKDPDKLLAVRKMACDQLDKVWPYIAEDVK